MADTWDVAPDPDAPVELYTLIVDAAGEVIADCGIVGRSDEENERHARMIVEAVNLRGGAPRGVRCTCPPGTTVSTCPVCGGAEHREVPEPQGRYIVDGTTYLRASGDTLQQAVERWQKLANGGYPDGWEDAEAGEEGLIVGGCESCGRPILDGERYAVDDDLVYECSECMEPRVPDEAVGGLMEGIERTGGEA